MGEEKFKKVNIQTYKLPNDINLEDITFGNSWLKETARDHAYDAMRYAIEDIRTTRAYNQCCNEKKAREIKKVIFNDKMTIVIWGDGTKTMVKCEEKEFDKEKGLAMAIAKKFLGTNESKGNYFNVFKKWIPELVEEKNILNQGLSFSLKFDESKFAGFKNNLIKAFSLSKMEEDDE